MVNEICKAIVNRRTIRSYTQEEVEKEKLTRLLEAAMAAPNAANSQPWEFVVVTDSNIMCRLREVLFGGHYNAPAAIIVCGNEKIANNSAARFFWVQDCSAATENICLAAVGMGLGTAWIGVHPIPSIIKPVSEITNLPEEVIPLNVIFVGYPAEVKPARTQYDESRVHWQQYEPRKKKAKVRNAKYLP